MTCKFGLRRPTAKTMKSNFSRSAKSLLRLLVAICALSTWSLADAADEVVFRSKSGRVLTREDLKNFSGKADWEIHSGKLIPAQARRLHELGQEAGSRGNSAAALAYFEQATQLAPGWSYPKYDAAYTYLLQKDDDRAYQLYQEVDKMEPRGFFTVKTAVDVLKREREGKLPRGTYREYLALEWAKDDAQKMRQLLALERRVPQASIVWQELAYLEKDPAKRLALIDKGLAADGDIETRGFLLINKALTLNELGRHGVAVNMLGELALDSSSSLGIEVMAKKSLANITEKE